jgi:hypothetical protein
MDEEAVRDLDLEEKRPGQKIGGQSDDIVEENTQGMISILAALITVRWSFPEAGKVGDRNGATGMFTLWTIRQYHERFHGPVLLLFRPDNFQASVFTKEKSLTGLGTDVALCHS